MSKNPTPFHVEIKNVRMSNCGVALEAGNIPHLDIGDSGFDNNGQDIVAKSIEDLNIRRTTFEKKAPRKFFSGHRQVLIGTTTNG